MRIAATSVLGRYRWRDFVDLDEDDPRELIDGNLVEVEMPTRAHEHVVAILVALLVFWSRRRGAQGFAYSRRPSRG